MLGIFTNTDLYCKVLIGANLVGTTFIVIEPQPPTTPCYLVTM